MTEKKLKKLLEKHDYVFESVTIEAIGDGWVVFINFAESQAMLAAGVGLTTSAKAQREFNKYVRITNYLYGLNPRGEIINRH